MITSIKSDNIYYDLGALLALIENVRLHSENLELIADFVRKLEPKIMMTPIEDDLPIQTGDATNFIKLLQDAIGRLDDYTKKLVVEN